MNTAAACTDPDRTAFEAIAENPWLGPVWLESATQIADELYELRRRGRGAWLRVLPTPWLPPAEALERGRSVRPTDDAPARPAGLDPAWIPVDTWLAGAVSLDPANPDSFVVTMHVAAAGRAARVRSMQLLGWEQLTDRPLQPADAAVLRWGMSRLCSVYDVARVVILAMVLVGDLRPGDLLATDVIASDT